MYLKGHNRNYNLSYNQHHVITTEKDQEEKVLTLSL